MRKSRKIAVTLNVLLAVMLLLSACANSKNDGKAASTAPGAPESSQPAGEKPQADPVTLTMLINKDWYTESFQAALNRYEEKTGNKLDVQVTPGGQPFSDALAGKMAANEIPDIVAYYGTESQLKSIQADQNFLDISGEPYISKISPAIAEVPVYLKVGGVQYGIPAAAVNVTGVIYNKKVFAANGIEVPTTWEAFIAAAEKLKAANVTPIYEALKDGWPTLLFHYSLVANIVQKDNPGIIDQINGGSYDFTTDPAFRQVLEKLKEVADKGLYNKDAGSATYDSQIAALANGTAGMILQADWAIPVLIEKFPEAGKDIGMFPLPINDDPYLAFSDPWALYLNKNSKQLDAAKGFFEFFTSDENLNAYYGQMKGMPSFVGINTELNPGTAEVASLMEEGKAKPFYHGILAPGISVDFDRASIVLKGKSVDKVLEETQKGYLKSGKDAKLPGF
ncbi:hypothetical protein B1748_20005 [Paenibacillus sp. MY03]|jgi:raffinose/stachyose/melibiose transport system substrate-binding protein|uniref:ABC transporter substrate-binding protein n=1 Tax=Paenibacillus sp. MY03 TaxID=302980 RepID=UPI000B3C8116|nr:extracellular solute-binding protein [Paenibacillus sp. MY03]OUS74868.1 hypothetical protein B1748_20005 [Paenibacillus sp. MY03]